VDARIQAYLRGSAARGRETERIGPLPRDFRQRKRQPVLELRDPRRRRATVRRGGASARGGVRAARPPAAARVPARHGTGVEDALRAAGFEAEGRLPLMTRPSDRVVEPPRPEGVELLTPWTDEELLGATAAQSEHSAVRSQPRTRSGCARRSPRAGSPSRRASSRPGRSSARVCTPPADEVTELAGIGVQAAYRRRGIAGALTARLAQQAFAAGVGRDALSLSVTDRPTQRQSEGVSPGRLRD
jgi:hypothetical protein